VIPLDPISHALVLQGTFDQSKVTVPRMAANQVNYRQSLGGCYGLEGYLVSGANNISLDFLGKGHCDVDDDPAVQSMIVDQIRTVLAH
jgi:hypothetical protein